MGGSNREGERANELQQRGKGDHREVVSGPGRADDSLHTLGEGAEEACEDRGEACEGGQGRGEGGLLDLRVPESVVSVAVEVEEGLRGGEFGWPRKSTFCSREIREERALPGDPRVIR